MTMRTAEAGFLAAGFWAALSACTRDEPDPGFRAVPAEAVVVLHPEIAFANIRAVAETEEALWVLDDSPPFVTRVGRENESIMRGGERGEGPADFSLPVALQADPIEDLAHIWDIGNRRYAVFGPTLESVRSEAIHGGVWGGRSDIRATTYIDPYHTRIAGNDVLFVHYPAALHRTSDLLRGTVYRGDRTLRPRNELVRFSDYAGPETADALEFAAFPLWDACGPGLVVWDPLPGELAWLDGGGAPTATIPLGGRGPVLADTDIAAYLEAMARLEIGPGYTEAGIDFMAEARRVRELFSDRAPYATRLLCEDARTVWLQLFDNRTDALGRGRRWLRFDKAGTSETIEFPRAFRLLAVTPQRVLGAYEGLEAEEGQRLAEWKNPWNIP